LQALNLGAHVQAELSVEITQGFIKQQQVWFFNERPSQGHTLLLSTRKLRRFALQQVLQLHERRNMFDLVLDDSARLTLDTQGKGEILINAQVRIERIALKHHANIALAGWEIVDDPSIEAQRTTGRAIDAGQHQERGRLATATGSEQGQKFSLGDATTEILDCWYGAKILTDPFEGDGSHKR
jgi:hypothetical protein